MLVGHSLGGSLDVLYARTYPDEVAGLVIVDSPLPPYRDALEPDLFQQVRLISPTRALCPATSSRPTTSAPCSTRSRRPVHFPTSPSSSCGGVGRPMSDDPLPEGMTFTAAEVEALNTLQWDSQAQWAAGVPGAEVITVDGTTHYVLTQRPDAVVDAIREVIARA